MSKLDDLIAKLERLEQSKKDLETELQGIQSEIEDKQEMIDTINEALAERKQEQEEALATLITKRDAGGNITDSDFLEFGRVAKLDLSGLIDVPESPDAEEALTQVA